MLVRLLLAAVITATVTAAGATVPATATPVPTVSCKSPLGTTIRADRSVRVFSYRPPTERYARTWSCYRGQATARFLGDRGGPSVAIIALNGNWVAVVLKNSTGPEGPVFFIVRSLDARTGHGFARDGGDGYLNGDPSVDLSQFSGRELGVTSVVVSRHGSVAWIVSPPEDVPGGPATIQMSTRPSPNSRTAVKLAQAVDIDLGSLALSSDDKTLYWTQARQPHSAPMT